MAFVMTLTDDNDMAAAAMTGETRMPKVGYKGGSGNLNTGDKWSFCLRAA